MLATAQRQSPFCARQNNTLIKPRGFSFPFLWFLSILATSCKIRNRKINKPVGGRGLRVFFPAQESTGSKVEAVQRNSLL